MLNIVEANDNITSKGSQFIKESDTVVDVSHFYRQFATKLSVYLEYCIDVNGVKTSTYKQIFLEILMLLINRDDLNIGCDQVTDILDYHIAEDQNIDTYYDFSGLHDYDNNINELFITITRDFANYKAIDYIATSDDKVSIVLNLKLEKEAKDDKRVFIEFPPEIEMILNMYSIDTKNINTFLFISSLIDLALNISRATGDIDIDVELENILLTKKMMAGDDTNISFNSIYFSDLDKESFKNGINKFVDIILEKYVLFEYANNIIVESILNGKIILISRSNNGKIRKG